MNLSETVRQFHLATGLEARRTQHPMNGDVEPLLKFREELIREEVNEFYQAVKDEEPLENICKELADILYVVLGTGVSLGVDLESIFYAVHDSNMQKARGTVEKREDGKVLKGSNYVDPRDRIRKMLTTLP